MIRPHSTVNTTNIFQEFGGANFDPEQAAFDMCQGAENSKTVEDQIARCDASHAVLNEKIVRILETDSRLFITLSQCISNFEREFSEFPHKIVELQKMVTEAKNFGEPEFDNDPPIPKAPDGEIIGADYRLINAPLKYEALVQQHRINESVNLVVKCIQQRGQVKFIDEWVDKTREVIYKDIQGRLKSLQVNSEEAKRELSQLLKLGFEEETINIFLGLANKALDDKLGTIPNTGQFLQYIRATSNLLCLELAETAKTFMDLFSEIPATDYSKKAKHSSDDYLPVLISWVMKQIETRMPISHPEIFAGNFNLVKDSVAIMVESTKPLDEIGISTLHIFEAAPKKAADLLALAANQHVAEIEDSIVDDEWDLDLSDIGEIQVNEYPVSSSYEIFRAHLIQFSQELKYLYDSEIFYDCSRMMKQVLLCYYRKCVELLKEEQNGAETYCAIIAELVCIRDILIVEALKEFKDITGSDFPDQKSVANECQKTINEIISLLIETFRSMWAPILSDDRIYQSELGVVHPVFTSAIDVLTQFVGLLKLPVSVYQQTTDILAENIIRVVKESKGCVLEPEELDSFDFHWLYFSHSVGYIFAEKTNEKFRKDVKAISNARAEELLIKPHERVSPAEVNNAVLNALKEDEEEDE